MRNRNYTGVKLNHLTLLKRVRAGGQGVGAVWLARCDCGVEREVVARKVVHGQLKSCGKCELSRNLAASGRQLGGALRAAERRLLTRYMEKAANKKIGWELTPEQFRSIIGSSCAYCGRAPDRFIRGAKLKYNGVDRVYSEGKYTLTNCTPACSMCRALKGELNARSFLDIVMNIASHISHQMTQKQK